jgi:hypothetical protein
MRQKNRDLLMSVARKPGRVGVLGKDEEAKRVELTDSDIYVHFALGTCNADVISTRDC